MESAVRRTTLRRVCLGATGITLLAVVWLVSLRGPSIADVVRESEPRPVEHAPDRETDYPGRTERQPLEGSVSDRNVVVCVSDDGGAPVAHARLAVQGRGIIETDDGGLAITPWEGERVEVTLQSWPGNGDKRLFLSTVKRRRVIDANSDGFCEYVLSRTGVLLIKVACPAGLVASVLVYATDANVSSSMWRADVSDGVATFGSMPPGIMSVELLPASASPYMPTVHTAEIFPGRESILAIYPVLGRGTIRGRVVSDDGHPVVGIVVTAMSSVPRERTKPKEAVTGSGGLFEIVGLPMEEVRVSVDVKSMPQRGYAFFGSVDQPWILVNAASDRDIVLPVAHGFTLKVVPSGIIAHARPVLVINPGRYRISDSTSLAEQASGEECYVFSHLREGTYDIWLEGNPATVKRITIGEASCVNRVCRISFP